MFTRFRFTRFGDDAVRHEKLIDALMAGKLAEADECVSLGAQPSQFIDVEIRRILLLCPLQTVTYLMSHFDYSAQLLWAIESCIAHNLADKLRLLLTHADVCGSWFQDVGRLHPSPHIVDMLLSKQLLNTAAVTSIVCRQSTEPATVLRLLQLLDLHGTRDDVLIRKAMAVACARGDMPTFLHLAALKDLTHWALNDGFIAACEKGQFDMVERIMAHPLFVCSNAALVAAIHADNCNVVRTLLLTFTGYLKLINPFCHLVKHNQGDMLDMLLCIARTRAALLEATDHYDVAIFYNNVNAVRILLRRRVPGCVNEKRITKAPLVIQRVLVTATPMRFSRTFLQHLGRQRTSAWFCAAQIKSSAY